MGYARSVLGAPSPRRSSSRIAVARFGIRVWNRNSSIAAISSVDTLNCKRSVRSGVNSVPHASLALVLPGRLAITPPPEKCEKKSSAAQKSSGWRGRNSRCGTYIRCMLFERLRLGRDGLCRAVPAIPVDGEVVAWTKWARHIRHAPAWPETQRQCFVSRIRLAHFVSPQKGRACLRGEPPVEGPALAPPAAGFFFGARAPNGWPRPHVITLPGLVSLLSGIDAVLLEPVEDTREVHRMLSQQHTGQ